MTSIDTSKPVLVSGATGYVAGVLIEKLLSEGFQVHGTVRDPSKTQKLQNLNDVADRLPGSIRYFKADLLEERSFADAMAGCEIVFHTASPFTSNFDDPQKDLVDPALKGTQNVLNQANQTPSVRRVVVTSSVAAIYGDNADLQHAQGDAFTEDDWNTTSTLDHHAYYLSKTLAEKEAWKIAQSQDRWRLTTINPMLVIGPSVNPAADSESFRLIKNFVDGTFKTGVPQYELGTVDVRDVAQAHFESAMRDDAEGRCILSVANTSLPEIASTLRDVFGDRFPVPTRTLPKWLIWLVGPLVDKQMTRQTVSKNIGYPFRADSTKSRQQLGIRYRPMKESLTDMVNQMVDREMVG